MHAIVFIVLEVGVQVCCKFQEGEDGVCVVNVQLPCEVAPDLATPLPLCKFGFILPLKTRLPCAVQMTRMLILLLPPTPCEWVY